MADNKKPINKKPKISPFWIYGIIIVAFLGIQMLSGGMGSSVGMPTTQGKFFEYLENGDVEKVLIINQRKAKVYLTNQAADKPEHKNSVKPSIIPQLGKSPNYEFQFGDLALFENRVEEIKKEHNLITEIDFDIESTSDFARAKKTPDRN